MPFVYDGFFYIKVKEKAVLSDYAYTIIITEVYKQKLVPLISKELISRKYYIDHIELEIRKWS